MTNAFDIPDTLDSGDPAITRMVRMAQNLIDQESLVSDLEDNLSEAKKLLNQMKTIEFPDMMAECGLSEFKHAASGAKIAISDFVGGSLPKEPERRAAAIDYLSSHGAEAIIKTEISLAFTKNEHNIALALAEELRSRGLPYEIASGVHAQTLLAYARETMRRGEEIPLETLGLFAGRVAKVTWPKNKEKK